MSDDWQEEFDDEQSDMEDEETLVVACPNCGADVYEDAEQCPICGDYMVHDTRVWSGKPLWWILLAVVGVVATVAALLGLV